MAHPEEYRYDTPLRVEPLGSEWCVMVGDTVIFVSGENEECLRFRDEIEPFETLPQYMKYTGDVEEIMKVATLRNGSKEVLSEVIITNMALLEMIKYPTLLIRLIEIAKNPKSSPYSSKNINDIRAIGKLVKSGLINEDGTMHSSTRNVILSSIEGDDLDMQIVNPVVSVADVLYD